MYTDLITVSFESTGMKFANMKTSDKKIKADQLFLSTFSLNGDSQPDY